jgi:predicted metal-dependent phosphoesterase TrpH
MLRTEFHCHTIYSGDCLLTPANLIACCRRKGIDRVIVTDHNTIGGALASRAIDPERIIVGEEIMTTHGELLAVYVLEEVPAGLSPRETVSRLRDQGAFISVAHPFDRWRKGGWKEDDLLEIIGLVDAIEVFNSRCMSPADNRLALDFSRAQNLPGTVGSDAHTAWELGRSTMLMPPFTGAADLRAALPHAMAQTRLSPPLIHLSSRYAKWIKQRGHGLDAARAA